MTRVCVFGVLMLGLGFVLGRVSKPRELVEPALVESGVSLLGDSRSGGSPKLRVEALRAELKRTDRRAFSVLLDELIEMEASQPYEFSVLFYHWAKVDHEEALRFIERIPDSQERRQARNGLFGGWGGVDPAAAVLEARKIRSREARLEVLSQIGLGADPGDVESAIAMLESLGLRGGERATVIEKLFLSHFDEAPEATLEWVRSLPSVERQALLRQRLGSVIEKSPELARRLYAENRGMDFGFHNSITLARALIGSDIEAAKAWVEELPTGNTQRDVRNVVVRALSERDPEEAAAYIEELGLMRTEGDKLVHHWFETDREALVAWVAGQEHEATGSHLEASLAGRWAQDDPEGALDYLSGVGTESERLSNAKAVVSSWARQEPRRAADYVQGLPAAEQVPLMSSLVEGVSSKDPKWAAELLDAHLSALEEPSGARKYADAVGRVASQWSNLDLEAAGAWSRSLENDRLRRRAVEAVASDWVRGDLQGASEWIATLDPGAARDRAVSMLTGQLVGPDPERAFAWGLTLEDVEHRASKLEDILTSWRDRDYDAAYQAFQAAELDEGTRETLSWRFKN